MPFPTWARHFKMGGRGGAQAKLGLVVYSVPLMEICIVSMVDEVTDPQHRFFTSRNMFVLVDGLSE